MTIEINILLVCFLGAFSTFFSGFGLGTMLLPVFSLYFPLEVAILMTAVVHFGHSIFKVLLMANRINFSLFKKFGITALLGALVGALLLAFVGSLGTIYRIQIIEVREVSYVAFFVACLMMVFVYFEWKQIRFTFSSRSFFLPIGGFISGFFGGFSGHQGALRSAFLSKINMDKYQFVATSAFISFIIDFARISVYVKDTDFQSLDLNLISFGLIGAFLGSILGKKYLEKISYMWIQRLIAFFLILMSLLILTGII